MILFRLFRIYGDGNWEFDIEKVIKKSTFIHFWRENSNMLKNSVEPDSAMLSNAQQFSALLSSFQQFPAMLNNAQQFSAMQC